MNDKLAAPRPTSRAGTESLPPTITMSFARTLRSAAPLRNAVRSAAAPTARRAYSTAPQAAKGGNTMLFGALGLAALGAGGYFALNSQSGPSDPTKIKSASMPKETNYQE